jgi:hypothetical protein
MGGTLIEARAAIALVIAGLDPANPSPSEKGFYEEDGPAGQARG